MKTGIQILLWLLCAGLAYMIYQSITGPIQFQKVRQERYSKVISNLKDIRISQEAHKTVKGSYAKNFKSLINFVDTGNFTITQQKDSSFVRFDKAFGIDMPRDTVIIDTLGFVSIKDSLFRKDDRFKTMMNVPGATGGEKLEMEAKIIDKGGYKAPVFEVKVAKKVVLGDQPKDLLDRELTHNSVEEVNGEYISVGSLTQVSTSGNWPPVYDRRSKN